MRPARFITTLIFVSIGCLAATPAFAEEGCDAAVEAAAAGVRQNSRLDDAPRAEVLRQCGDAGLSWVVDELTADWVCDQAAQLGRSLPRDPGMDAAIASADACLGRQVRATLDDLDREALAWDASEPSGTPEAGSMRGGDFSGYGPAPQSTPGALGRSGSGAGGGGLLGSVASGGAPKAKKARRSGAMTRSPGPNRGRAATGAGSYAGPVASADSSSPIRRGAKVAWSRLELGVWFDYDSAALRPEALATLAELSRTLRRMDRTSVLEIVGHTDSTGSWYYNQELSERRASSVRQTLVLSGINRHQLTMRGAGEGDPVASNRSSWGRRQNRRVEFRFYRPIAYVTR